MFVISVVIHISLIRFFILNFEYFFSFFFKNNPFLLEIASHNSKNSTNV